MAATRRIVVVGGGVFGAASALEFCSRGWRVTLLDPHPLPFADASSTDVSKLVRMDYGADVFYHELAEVALEGWDRWNADWPVPPYLEDGLLVLSRHAMVPGGFEHDSWRVLRDRGYEPERLSTEVLARFTAWNPASHGDGYLNRRGGWAKSALVVAHLIELAKSAGASVRQDGFDALLWVRSTVGGVVTASGERIGADVVLVCAGAWTPTLLPWLADRMWATAQPVLHFGPADPSMFCTPKFLPWAADIAGSGWYGFPATHDGHVKIGHHGTGSPVDPATRGEVSPEHEAKARAFLRASIPSLADAPVVLRRICLYCDTFDGDFFIGHDPDRSGLMVASGGSGHAFKFAPILGSLVADVAERRPNPWSHRFRWRAAGEARFEAARYVDD